MGGLFFTDESCSTPLNGAMSVDVGKVLLSWPCTHASLTPHLAFSQLLTKLPRMYSMAFWMSMPDQSSKMWQIQAAQ